MNGPSSPDLASNGACDWRDKAGIVPSMVACFSCVPLVPLGCLAGQHYQHDVCLCSLQEEALALLSSEGVLNVPRVLASGDQPQPYLVTHPVDRHLGVGDPPELIVQAILDRCRDDGDAEQPASVPCTAL